MSMKWIGIFAWLFASLLSSQAQVFELSPFFGYRFGGSVKTSDGEDTCLDPGRAYGVALDFAPQASDLKLELFWSRQDTGFDSGGFEGFNHIHLSIDEFQFGGVYEAGQGRLRETVTALVGATLFSSDAGDREARFSFGIGVGVKYYLLKHLALRADLRGYGTVVEADAAFISSGGGAVAYFSGDAIWQGEIAGGISLSF